jgi:3-isopropylmalate/(R)-2-methylmalate dehydratase small subunit
MEPFTRIDGRAIPLPAANVDTDIIFPARFLLITAKVGLGRYAFQDWRYRPDGAELADCVFNQARYKGAEILVAGDNFGCGSSREQAPWALKDLGIRCVVSTSFGEIFYNNCFKNGILAILVSTDRLAMLMAEAEAGLVLEVDLLTQVLRGRKVGQIKFTVEPWRREALLHGWDEIAIVLQQSSSDIAAFELRQRVQNAWLYQGE